MKWEKGIKIATTLTAFGLAAFAGPAAAIPIEYSGYDVGSTTLAGSPNATDAASAFDLATGSLSIIDFETAVPTGVSISGGSIGDATSTSVCATAALHCYATSSTNVYRNNGATFGFANPIDSFGAYWTGWQNSGQTITIEYSGGGTDVLNMPAGSSEGGTVFFGFTDFGASITGIVYSALDASGSSTDAVGFDDVRFGSADSTSVPEPTTLTLLCAGLIGLGMMGRRKVAV